MGVTRGDRVGLFMPNGPEFIEILFGILFTGAVAVPVNARFTARELGHVVRDADLKVLLASDAPGEPRTRADVIAEALGPDLATTWAVVAAGPALRPDQGSGGMMSQEAFGQLAEQCQRRDRGAPPAGGAARPGHHVLHLGHHGDAQGLLLSHEAQVRTGVTTRFRLGYGDGERVFAPCPMFHTASTQPMVATLHAVGTFVSMAHFEPGAGPRADRGRTGDAPVPGLPAAHAGHAQQPGLLPRAASPASARCSRWPRPRRCGPCSDGCRTAPWSTPTA